MMPDHQVGRKSAMRFARYAQGATAALAALAVGAAVFAVPGMGVAPAASMTPPTPIETDLPGDSADDEPMAIDFEGMWSRYLGMKNAPQPKADDPEQAEVIDIAQASDDGPKPRAASSQVRYIGSMRKPSGKLLAFVVLDGKQGFARVGDTVGDWTIKKVEPDHIILEGDAGEKQIDLQTKTGRSITTATSGARAAGAPVSARDRVLEQSRNRSTQEADLERRRDVQNRGNRRND